MQAMCERCGKMKELCKAMAMIVFVIAIDLCTKYCVVHNIIPRGHVCEVLNIVYVVNRGVTFGMFKDVSPVFINGFTMCLVLFLIYFTISSRKNRMLYIMIIGGGIGNIIDRLYRGYVVDFLDFHIGQYHWPVFNMADVFISIGVGVIIFKSLFASSK